MRRSGHRRVKISLSNWTAYTDSDTARNFSSTSHVLFLRCRNVLVVGEHEGNEEREKGQVAKPRLIAYRPLVSKVHRGKAQFPTRPVCSSLTAISRTRIAAPSKDLHLIIARPGVRTEERPRVSDKGSTPGPARLVLRARDEATLMTRRRFSFFSQKRTDALCFSFFFSFLSNVKFYVKRSIAKSTERCLLRAATGACVHGRCRMRRLELKSQRNDCLRLRTRWA